jgi:hypothetical protein
VGLAIGWARVGLGRPVRAIAMGLAPLAGGAVIVGSTLVLGGDRVTVILADEYIAAAACLVPVALLASLVALALVLEGRVIRVELGREVEMGVLPGWVVHAVASFRRRAFGSWWLPRDERRVVSQLLTRLAFRLRTLRHAGGDALRVRGLEVGRLRQRAKGVFSLRRDGAGSASGDE